MSEFTVDVHWQGATAPPPAPFCRDHEWHLGSGAIVAASSASEYGGNSTRTNPEEALVAALSGCHMLTFLAVCARKGIVVTRYDDHAVGILEKNAEGRISVTRATLRPRVEFAEGLAPDAETLTKLHEQAHRGCFIANSVKTVIAIEPRA